MAADTDMQHITDSLAALIKSGMLLEVEEYSELIKSGMLLEVEEYSESWRGVVSSGVNINIGC